MTMLVVVDIALGVWTVALVAVGAIRDSALLIGLGLGGYAGMVAVTAAAGQETMAAAMLLVLAYNAAVVGRAMAL